MSVFIAAQDHDLLQRNRLDSFDALWALQLVEIGRAHV